MRRVLLPESGDPRVLRAAGEVAAGGRAKPVLLGAPPADAPAGVEWLAPAPARYANLLRQRHKKPLSAGEADALLADPAYLAALMLVAGDVDGVVVGASAPTAHVVRAALRVVKLRPGAQTASGFFLMRLPQGDMLFADCALVAEPTAAQLADIAAMTATSAEALLPSPPVVAMLSFSTAGSADHPAATKVAQATALARALCPKVRIVGEIQADAALDVALAKRKGLLLPAPANVFIFPDLNAGNIAYKIAQRLTGCEAVGPVLQGLNKPFNDLSRGATVADIAAMTELTARQAEAQPPALSLT